MTSLKKKESGSYLSGSPQWDSPESRGSSSDTDDAQAGVKVVEAAEKVYGKYSKWFLFIGYVRSCRDRTMSCSAAHYTTL